MGTLFWGYLTGSSGKVIFWPTITDPWKDWPCFYLLAWQHINRWAVRTQDEPWDIRMNCCSFIFWPFQHLCNPLQLSLAESSSWAAPKTRESADSPPCNCRHLFFFILKMKCWKPSVFYIVHLWKAFREYHLYCVGQFKMNKAVFRAGETIIFLPRREKQFGNACWSKKSHLPQAFGKFFQNGTCLWWKHFASTGSFAPTSNDFRWFLQGICLFGQKRLASMFSSFFGMCKRNNIFYERNIKLVFAHINSMCKSSNIFYMNETSNLCSRTCTTRASVAAYFFTVACHRTLLFPPHPTPPHL